VPEVAFRDKDATQKELARVEVERAALQRKLDESRRQAACAESLAAQRSQSAAALDARLRELQSELDVSRRRQAELQASHEDYIRLRTRRDEAEYLKSEVERLSAELLQARAGGGMVTPPARAHVSATGLDQLSHLSLAEALDQTVQGLLGEGVRSVVLADEVGFPVTHTDDNGASLAAFSTLVTGAGDRANEFAPIGRTRQISIVDEGGARISIWPFDQGGARLALITLSRSPLDKTRVSATLCQLTTLLNRPRIAIAACP
jgi:hypothetical protein